MYFIVEDPKYREANTGDGFAFVPWTPSFVCAKSGKVESNSIVASMSKNKNKVWHDTRVTIISLLIQVHLFFVTGTRINDRRYISYAWRTRPLV